MIPALQFERINADDECLARQDHISCLFLPPTLVWEQT